MHTGGGGEGGIKRVIWTPYNKSNPWNKSFEYPTDLEFQTPGFGQIRTCSYFIVHPCTKDLGGFTKIGWIFWKMCLKPNPWYRYLKSQIMNRHKTNPKSGFVLSSTNQTFLEFGFVITIRYKFVKSQYKSTGLQFPNTIPATFQNKLVKILITKCLNLVYLAL